MRRGNASFKAVLYTTNGLLWIALWDSWKKDGSGNVTDYAKDKAQEFRYDSGRARYLARPVDTTYFEPTGSDALWTDYDGDAPYGDFSVALSSGTPTVTEQVRYVAGLGVFARQTVSGGAGRYLHDDLIGSTVLTTDDSGAGSSSRTLCYTAFGEAVGSVPSDNDVSRYQYAGNWGYETGLLTLNGTSGTAPIALQHVGARWYQPESGRFVQRDPIGLDGGLNVYAYCLNDPLSTYDPDGLQVRPIPTVPPRDTVIPREVYPPIRAPDGPLFLDPEKYNERDARSTLLWIWGFQPVPFCIPPPKREGWWCSACGKWEPNSSIRHLHAGR